MTHALWLPGWCMLPTLFPEKALSKFFSFPVQAALPWPGYIMHNPSVSELWHTENLVSWLDQYINSISFGRPVVLIGWSMGGLLALCYALRFPHKVAHLNLWATSACFMENETHPGQTKMAVNALYKGVQERDQKVIYRFLKSLVPVGANFREKRRNGYRFVEENLALPHWEALEASLDWLIRTDIRDQLADIKLSVEIHHGTADVIIPVAAGEYLAKHIPHACWYSYEGRGHAWWLGENGDKGECNIASIFSY